MTKQNFTTFCLVAKRLRTFHKDLRKPFYDILLKTRPKCVSCGGCNAELRPLCNDCGDWNCPCMTLLRNHESHRAHKCLRYECLGLECNCYDDWKDEFLNRIVPDLPIDSIQTSTHAEYVCLDCLSIESMFTSQCSKWNTLTFKKMSLLIGKRVGNTSTSFYWASAHNRMKRVKLLLSYGASKSKF